MEIRLSRATLLQYNSNTVEFVMKYILQYLLVFIIINTDRLISQLIHLVKQ